MRKWLIDSEQLLIRYQSTSLRRGGFSLCPMSMRIDFRILQCLMLKISMTYTDTLDYRCYFQRTMIACSQKRSLYEPRMSIASLKGTIIIIINLIPGYTTIHYWVVWCIIDAYVIANNTY